MARMGHPSTRAAMIYQRATQDRDRIIAQALGQTLSTARTETQQKDAPKKGHRKRTA